MRETGRIKRIVEDKGFAFIERQKPKSDVFLHNTVLEGLNFSDLRIGDVIEFDLIQTAKGPRAIEARRTKKAAQQVPRRPASRRDTR